MKVDDLDTLLAEAQARLSEARADVDALERVRRMRLRQPSANGTEADEESISTPSAPRGQLMDAIKRFINSRHGNFTMLDVFKEIDEAGQIAPKKQSIKAALGSLEKKGVIATVTRGTGRKPSVYRKK